MKGLLRDIRDATGAATISLTMFGLPVALALMQLSMTPDLGMLIDLPPAREAAFVMSMPALSMPAPAAPPEAAPPAAAPPGAARADRADANTRPQSDTQADGADAVASDGPSAGDGAGDGTDAAPADPELLARTEPTAAGPTRAPDLVRARRPSVPGPQVIPHVMRPDLFRERDLQAAAAAPRGRRCEEQTGAIQDQGDGVYVVERKLVDMYVSDLELAESLASVSWHRDEEGRVDGFRIRRIRCGTVLAQAGFLNGDVVHSVNGHKVRTIFGAIAAYRRLKHKDYLRVDVTGPRGVDRQLKYRIS